MLAWVVVSAISVALPNTAVRPIVIAIFLNVVFMVVLLFDFLFEFLLPGTAGRKARSWPMLSKHIALTGND